MEKSVFLSLLYVLLNFGGILGFLEIYCASPGIYLLCFSSLLFWKLIEGSPHASMYNFFQDELHLRILV